MASGGDFGTKNLENHLKSISFYIEISKNAANRLHNARSSSTMYVTVHCEVARHTHARTRTLLRWVVLAVIEGINYE